MAKVSIGTPTNRPDIRLQPSSAHLEKWLARGRGPYTITPRAGRGAQTLRLSAPGWLLEREGQVLNRKKLYRLYREEKLMVPFAR
jgi:hypothetical protein